MSRSSLRIPAFLRTGVSLTLSGLLIAGSGFAETPKAGATATTGALSITTDPADAAVYVDGRLAGQTPASLSSIAAGEHRVRIVKTGYLENARVVTVSAGAPTALKVTLTRSTSSSATSAPAEQVTSTGGGGGGGGSKKWIIIGAAAGGAVAAGVILAHKNSPPNPGTVSVSPTGTGMAGATVFTFTSQGASDPDNDTLTKTWSFSDGGTGTGDAPTHTFQNTGTFTATLTVDDGHNHKVTAPNASVTVGPPVGGTWTGGSENVFGCGMNFTLTQNGTAVSGSESLSGGCSGSIALASASISGLTHPTNVTWTTQVFQFTQGSTIFPNLTWKFTGSTDSTGTTMTGSITLTQSSSGFTSSNNTTFRRQ